MVSEARKLYSKQWKAAHPERIKELKKQSYHRCKKEYYAKNREKFIKAARRSHLKRKFGLTEEQYEQLLEKQNRQCAICEDPLVFGKGGASIDHDHKTGKVRGILCVLCNTLIGKAKEDKRVLLSAIAYLERHKDDLSR